MKHVRFTAADLSMTLQLVARGRKVADIARTLDRPEVLVAIKIDELRLRPGMAMFRDRNSTR
jgi:hypothetical protein